MKGMYTLVKVIHFWNITQNEKNKKTKKKKQKNKNKKTKKLLVNTI